MSRRLKYLAICLECGSVAVAQVPITVGPFYGANFGTLSFSPSSYSPLTGHYPASGGTQIRRGLMIGLQAEVGSSDSWSLVFQPRYAEKGAKASGPLGSILIAIDEMELAVLFKERLLAGPVRPFVFAGPNLGFVLSAEQNIHFPPDEPTSENLMQRTHTNFSVSCGAGIDFAITPGFTITANADYSFGIVSVLSAAWFMESPRVTTEASGFQFLFGALIRVN